MRTPLLAALGLLAATAGTAPAQAAWQDTVAVSGATIATVTPQAPVASCGLLSLGSTRIDWTPVQHATGYRLHYGVLGSTTADVPASVTSRTFSGVLEVSTFWVEALYGPWKSEASNSLTYTALLFVLGTCA